MRQIISRNADIVLLVVQNSIIIELSYLHLDGVSKYAALLNVLHLTLIVIVGKYIATYFNGACNGGVKFLVFFLYQSINALLLCCFVLGHLYLGMPFEVEMIYANRSGLSNFFANYGFNFQLIIAVFFAYIVCTSYILAYVSKTQSHDRRFFYISALLLLAAYHLLPLSLTRDPYLLTIFGHGFDGAPIEITKKKHWPKLDYGNAHLYQVNHRPIVLVVVDAARSDVLQVHEGNSNLTFLNQLHDQGNIKQFPESYSICQVTYCGILGILGSSYWNGLPQHGQMIQDYLKQNGYRNYFILSGDYRRYHGLSKMFGNNVSQFVDGTMLQGNPNDDENIIRFIRSLKIDSKTFLYVHLMSMHSGGVLKINRGQSNLSLNQTRTLFVKNNEFKDRYLLSAKQIDNFIEQIFSVLKDSGHINDALVIITSDHGEYLGEKGKIGHAANNFPYEQGVRIPLIIYDRKNAYSVSVISSQVDIAPTIVRAIAGEIPANWQGVPLQSITARCAVRNDSSVYSSKIGFVDGGKFKYVKYKGLESVFDLEGDPTESHPIGNILDITRIRNSLESCLSAR